MYWKLEVLSQKAAAVTSGTTIGKPQPMDTMSRLDPSHRLAILSTWLQIYYIFAMQCYMIFALLTVLLESAFVLFHSTMTCYKTPVNVFLQFVTVKVLFQDLLHDISRVLWHSVILPDNDTHATMALTSCYIFSMSIFVTFTLTFFGEYYVTL